MHSASGPRARAGSVDDFADAHPAERPGALCPAVQVLREHAGEAQGASGEFRLEARSTGAQADVAVDRG
ncbi:MAG: hypothetical protein WBB94_01265 [Candidatus Saccharimonadaceae bacterium]